MAKGKYIDVNKEDYMKALFTEICSKNKMVSFPDIGKMVHEFVSNNPTGGNLSLSSKQKADTISSDGLRRNAEGYIIISRRKKVEIKKKKK